MKLYYLNTVINYRIEIGVNNLTPISDVLCQELDSQVGDILLSEASASSLEIVMAKHGDNILNDVEIASAENLTRVMSLPEGLWQ